MLSFTECRVLVIGDVMLDEYTETHVNRISPEAPVPVAHVQRHWSVPGGAANVARNLACLGCGVTLVGLRAHDRKLRLCKKGLFERLPSERNYRTGCWRPPQ